MNLFISILIIAGISLDVFATMEVEGAMISEIKKEQMVVACAVTTGLSLLFFFTGYFVCYKINEYDVFSYEERTSSIIAAVVFVLLGIRLIVKAIRKEFTQETRQEFKLKQYLRLVVTTSFYTLATGCACGLVEADPIVMMITIVICFVLVVIFGILTGYHFGFELKTYAYAAGSVLLWVAAIYLMITEFL